MTESWVQRTDTTSGRSYYVNLSTGQSSWSLPIGGQLGRNVQRHERVAGLASDGTFQSANMDPVLEEVEV